MLENGFEECPCKKKGCERHGKCFECLEYHKQKKREAYCKRKNIAAPLSRKVRNKLQVNFTFSNKGLRHCFLCQLDKLLLNE